MSHTHHDHAHDHYAEHNQAHFDQQASKYEDHPMALPLTNLVATHILSAYPFNKETTRVLDYACGTGLMSRRLASEAKSIVGVDISQGMVDMYNERAQGGDLKAVRLELKGEAGELDDRKFDVITCNFAYHHFSDINGTTKILAHFLTPGGMLLVTDFGGEKDSLRDEEYKHIVAHQDGISEEVLKTAFEGAGLVMFQIKDVEKVTVKKEVMVVLASGVKA